MSAGIVGDGLGVRFLFDHNRRVVTPALARFRRRGLETWGLRGVSFEVRAGQGLALLGPSGSGKTTLLRVLGAVLEPDEGRLEVHGGVASLLSIDGGLLPVLTGRENARMLGVLAGVGRGQTERSLDEVQERSGLGEHFERPVSSFSQGMRARLGFAVAEQAEPEILLLDEVHEAFDDEYRSVLERRANALRDRGGIVIAAGHDHAVLERFCDSALFMAHGRLRAAGEFGRVRHAYLSAAV